MEKLRIRLLSDLCAGNGESVGNGIDNDICSDEYGFPYIPGKRILGCLRESAITLGEYGFPYATKENVEAVFGNVFGKTGLLRLDNAYLPGVETLHQYIRDLMKNGQDYLIRQSTEDKIIRLYTSVRGQTRIDASGKADHGSLRFIRVLNQYNPLAEGPLEFVAMIDIAGMGEEQKSLLNASCKALRHIGSDRNRGLGNVAVMLEMSDSGITEQNHGENPRTINEIREEDSSEEICISYETVLDAPIAMQGYLEKGSEINARSVMGAFSTVYLNQHHKVDRTFEQLFLDGSVTWSALTPLINGIPSDPAPLFLVKLKNGQGRLLNSFASSDSEWVKKKPRALDGYYAAFDEKEEVYYVSSPESVINYHNNLHETDPEKVKGLYMQEALLQGMVFGGSISAPAALKNVIVDMLSNGRIRIGGSRKTQYGATSVISFSERPCSTHKIHVNNNEPVFAILKSDLVLSPETDEIVDDHVIRRYISDVTGLSDCCPEPYHDICRYRVLGGYNTMWQMQKPKVLAVRGGSVYCFTGNEGDYDSEIVLGEFQQEGMGKIRIIPLSKLKQRRKAEYGKISEKETVGIPDIEQKLHDRLLFEAGMDELREYAFHFYKEKTAEDKDRKRSILKQVPARRLRKMLSESDSPKGLWKMVDTMKTSDVSSESQGKKKSSQDLLKEFYGITGPDSESINLGIIIKDKDLLYEIQRNKTVFNKVEENWKEPLITLLHMLHYQKGGEQA